MGEHFYLAARKMAGRAWGTSVSLNMVILPDEFDRTLVHRFKDPPVFNRTYTRIIQDTFLLVFHP